MLFFFEKDLVFLANPKAGSTAIESALEPLASLAVMRPPHLKHSDYRSFRQHIAPWLQPSGDRSLTTVAVMREPIEWLRSWYRFRMRDDVEDPLHEMTGVTFADFVQSYMSSDGRMRARIGTQSDFLTDQTQSVDHIFRYEEMENFTEFMEERLDCVLHLPRVNVPPSVDVSLSPDLETRLREFLAQDAALYDSLAVPCATIPA